MLAAVFDEVAFWRDETSASPDIEVYRAILPALASTGGMLIGISTAYRKVGLLYEKHRDHFGQTGDVLVIQASTERLNPTIDKRIISRARQSDPSAALSEWDAEFRNDISSFLDDAAIDGAIDRNRPIELPPRAHLFKYFAFTDASAGRRDHFTLGVAHLEGHRVVVDVIRGSQPPFDPQTIAHELAALARSYGCQEIVGDNYAGEWVAAAFREAGIGYRRSEMVRSALYLEMLPMFARGNISMPDHPRLVRELRLLERRTSRSGRDSIDHPANGSDDYANSLAGVAYQCGRSQKRSQAVRVGRATYTSNNKMRSRRPGPRYTSIPKTS